jgi:hypothetical protein
MLVSRTPGTAARETKFDAMSRQTRIPIKANPRRLERATAMWRNMEIG